MPVASFTFGQSPIHKLEVHWSPVGFEKYVLDGRLLAKRWSLSLSGERVFNVDGKRLRIVCRLLPKNYCSKVFLDDELIVPELFPEVAAKLEEARARGWGWRRFVVSLVVWMVVGFVGMYGYKYYKSQQMNASDCPKPKAMVAGSNAKSCS